MMDNLEQALSRRDLSGAMRRVSETAQKVEETAVKAGEETVRKAAEKSHAISAQLERALSKEPTNSFIRSVWLALAGGSVLGSLLLHAAGRKHAALLVGQWAPTLIGFALWDQIVRGQRPQTRRR